MHRVRPVDVAGPRPARAVGAGERAVDRLAGAVGEPLLEVGQHLGDDRTGGRPRLVGQQAVELDEQRDEVEIGLHRLEHLGFEQQPAQVEAFDRVALQHLHHRRGEVPPDVAQPACDPRRRATEPAGAAGGAAAGSPADWSPAALSRRRRSDSS